MIKFKLFKPWKKMSGYIGDILCVGGCQHDIAWRFIEGEKYRKILPIKLKKSADMVENCQFFGDIWR